MIPDVAIGVIFAALIAGLISLVGLIVAKEQKTSEFRQAWIDATRESISAYLTSLNSVHDALQVKYKDHAEKVDKLGPFYREANKSAMDLYLRLNPKESAHVELFDMMDEVWKISTKDETFKLEKLKDLEDSIVKKSQSILKSEWRRVKRGELAFVVAKWMAFTFVSVAIVALSIFVLMPEDRVGRGRQPLQGQPTAVELLPGKPRETPKTISQD